jgi:hypothetical protein
MSQAFDAVTSIHIKCLDWRLVKPKMHVVSQGDLPPDATEFDHHVRCEHGGLSLSSTTRRRISEKVGQLVCHAMPMLIGSQACRLLMNLYPSWEPVRSDTELCPVCDALIHISKEDKREVRKMAEEEKVSFFLKPHTLYLNLR